MTTTGTLEYGGTGKSGIVEYDYMRCVDCGEEYPIVRGAAMCNGHTINKCPYCRPDSVPWKFGRGE